MNLSLEKFEDLYFLALRDYLKGVEEQALERGYELGRQAVLNGVGVLEAVGIYKETLVKSLLHELEPRERGQIVRTIEFFAETLSPFEVTHRAFRETNVKLRLLSEHLQSVREEERTRISQDIHDELGRDLTCLKIDLSALHNQFLEKWNDQPPFSQRGDGERLEGKTFALTKIKSMLALIDQTIQTVRRIASELRPSVLDDLGLEAAIEWQVQEFQSRTGIECKLTLPSRTILISQKRSSSVFRIFQEILTNIARHARATRMRICLKKRNGSLILDVQDNGRGISARPKK